MLTTPMDVLSQFPVRKSNQQKQAFRDSVQSYAENMGYSCTVESGSFGVRNLIMGDPETAQYLVTAHYDTPAVSPFPNVCAPTSQRHFLGKLFSMIIVCTCFGFAGGNLMGRGYIIPGLLVFGIAFLLTLLLRCGPANQNNANDNTSGVVTVLEIMRILPPIHRNKVCFVLFDLEEAGLLGSKAYRKAHKQVTETQLMLNLDCVGDGDEIWFLPTKKLQKDKATLAFLGKCVGTVGKKRICVRYSGFTAYASDHKHFPRGVGIGAFHHKKGLGPYLTNIHTPKDTVLDQTNVNILRAAITTLISSNAAQ